MNKARIDFSAPLVSTAWLNAHLEADNLRIIDGTYFLPNIQRNAAIEYEAEHIPGACFFDIDDISDLQNTLPHMIPPAEIFSSRVRKMGISDSDYVVVYDRLGVFSSPRIWWTFQLFGHENIAILDGGLPKWLKEKLPVTDQKYSPKNGHFTAHLNTKFLRTFDQIKANLDTNKELIIDGRPPGRFSGEVEEPRPGLACGHIPGSVNLMPTLFMNAETGALLSKSELRNVFVKAGIDPEDPMAMTCGSGVAAAALSFVRFLVTGKIAPVYDGSWTEWGSIKGAPVATSQS